MEPQPDKLFRDKLGQYQKSAPPAAWERIEAGLQKPRRSFLFLKIAASILVLGSATYFLWPSGKSDVIVDNVKAVENVDGVYKVDEAENVYEVDKVDKVDEVDKAEEISSENSLLNKSNQIQENKKKIKSTQATIAESNNAGNNIAPEDAAPVVIAQPAIKTEPEVVRQVSPTETVVANPTKTTVHFAAAQVNAKYKKIYPQVQTTPDQKNPSILQKIADVAMDFTNDDGLLGELREKKNEFLSLDRLNRSHGPNK